MRTWLLTAVFCVWSGLSLAQTTEELVNAPGNTDNVTTQSMGYDRKNYSPLKANQQVERQAARAGLEHEPDERRWRARRRPSSTTASCTSSTASGRLPSTSRPAGRSGARRSRSNPASRRVAPFGAITRGAPTIYNGKLFRITLDNHLLALDMKTGKEVWNQKFADWNEGYTATGAPIVANGVVISGMAGGEFTTRGFLDGWDPETGKKLWRRYTVPAPGEPGSETWPTGQRRLEDWRRRHLAIRFVRPAARPGLLGHRQRRAVRPETARGARQPVHVQRDRDPPEDR